MLAVGWYHVTGDIAITKTSNAIQQGKRRELPRVCARPSNGLPCTNNLILKAMATNTKADIIKAINSKRHLVHTICLGDTALTVKQNKKDFLQMFKLVEESDREALDSIIITDGYVIV